VISWNVRFAVVAALLASTGLFQHMRARNVVALPRTPLASFPLQAGEWVGTDIPIAPIILNKLDHGEFLQRDYQDQNTKGTGGLYISLIFPISAPDDAATCPTIVWPVRVGQRWRPVQLHSP
jgi:hypothetical protein